MSNNYCFEGIDRDVIGKFDEAKETDEVMVVLGLVHLLGDEFTEVVLVPCDESVLVVDQQSVAEEVEDPFLIVQTVLVS